METKVRTKSAAIKKNKRECFMFVLIGVAGAVLGLPLALANNGEGGNGTLLLIGGVLAFFGVGFVLVTPFIWFWERRRISAAYCPKCEVAYHFDTDVAYESGMAETSDRGTEVEVEFNCRCHECGHERSYTRKFTASSYDQKTGNVKRYNIEKNIRNMFR